MRRPPASSRGVDERQLNRLLQAQPWAMLEPFLRECGSDATEAMDRLKRFAKHVIHWNRSVSNVMGKSDESRIVIRHLAESLAPAGRLKSRDLKSWLDFGSGAGFPAIPLAIAGVGERWLLVESRRQKTLFLRKAIESLELKNVKVATSRLETLEETPISDGFTSRATEGLDLTLELAARRVGPGGRAFLWGSGGRGAQISEGGPWRNEWESVEVVKLPESLSELAEFRRR